MSHRGDSRKRSREDEGTDLPLSKRINNLHLTNPGNVNGDGAYGHPNLSPRPGTSSSGSSSSSSHAANGMQMNGMDESYKQSNGVGQDMPMLNGHHHSHLNGHHTHHHHHQQQQQQHNNHNHHLPSTAAANRQEITSYDPELTAAENPNYYHRNKLLYELHFIRSRRCHPDND